MSTSLIGQPVARVDGRLKVTGAARYAADHLARNVAHAFLVKSTIGRGRVTVFDTAPADRLAGVLGIWSARKPIKFFLPGNSFMDGNVLGENLLPLQDDKVHYYGQTIGLVVAESYEIARQAASLVRVSYAEEKPVASFEDAQGTAFAPKDDPMVGPSELNRLAPGVKDFAAAMAGADVKVEATYHTPVGHHSTMEPHATVAQWDDERVTIWNCSQWMTGQKQTLAEVLGIPAEDVRVLCPFVGGGFGHKATLWMHSALVAAAARALKRPVKIALTREQTYNSVGYRPATIQSLQVGAKRDGKLVALRHAALSSQSMIHDFIEPAAHRTSPVLYDAPNLEVRHRVVNLNVGAPTWMRAPGEAPGMFALESAMDELAVLLKMDPIELRLKNYAETNPEKGLPWSSKHLKECYEKGAEMFGWSARDPEPGKRRDGDWLVGWGMASALYPGMRFPSSARVRVMADGTAIVSAATHDLGTGMYTIMCQVAAEALGLPIDRVKSELGDSSMPPAALAGGSMSSASVMPAVQAAAQGAVKKIAMLAAQDPKSPFSGMKPDELKIENGALTAAGKRESVAVQITRAGHAYVENTASSAPGAEAQKFAVSSFGAHFCEVRVHALTGEARVARWVAAMDIGRVLNARTARSQVLGGVTWGIGMALTEESVLDPRTARWTTGDLASYHVPVNADVPKIDVWFTDEPDLNFNPLGVRGVGEIGITGTTAAIANAIYHATGKRIRDLPITPDRILAPPKDRPALG